jgi:hypothetical protein
MNEQRTLDFDSIPGFSHLRPIFFVRPGAIAPARVVGYTIKSLHDSRRMTPSDGSASAGAARCRSSYFI